MKANPFCHFLSPFYQYCDSANTAKQAQQAAGQLQEANALDFHCIFIYYVCFVFENGGGFAKRFPR